MIKKNLIIFCFLCFINCFGQKLTHIKAPSIIYKNSLPTSVRDCWHNLDIQKDTLAGTSLNRAYKEIIKNKNGKQIIVAVIDTDIDINHEDLKTAIWVNKKEIPNNGIDDDHNGYVDDVNGWNFLGNKNGESISYANSEPTRILRRLKKKYDSFLNFRGNKKDSLLYLKAIDIYKEDFAQIDTLKKYASLNLSAFRENSKKLHQLFGKNKYTYFQIDSLYKKNKKADPKIVSSILSIRDYIRLGLTYDVLKRDSLKIIEKYKTTYNPQYYDRVLIGDDELDLKDNHYGNNNVSKNAKLTYHGTIVSGILGANRSNKIGIEGFSDQIKIMPILAVPTGGYENDKDIALAIRYAVDNGAKVINMSFGKTFSANPEWIKEAFLYAQQHDVLLIAGSGNDASDNDSKPFYPIDYDEDTGKEFCQNFIKVGGITFNGNKKFLANFTNYGKRTVDLFAPSFFLKTTDANVGYSYRDGTSMASPIVAGVAALVWSYYPKLSAAQLKQIILESGVSYNINVQVPGEKEGVLRPFKELSVSGKVVNAYNALLMAKEYSKK
ncbi:S8 family serine peptidase [Flavobacterium humi]|uniref:Peptidase S8 n=1 Tax=Flavobacterium humi TaxID=2562683 RepID=A0A4Z0LA55_9FLAO|nr:S8 family serine peptidase [Flavobacterium humi]TGD58731.1 peptidase S8 [Flavobacterium humi]